MKNFQTFQVFPNVPISLEFLEDLSRNLWWCWKKDAIELFRRIDPPLWGETGRNPIAFLAKISQERFEQLAGDEGYLAHLERVKDNFQNRVLDPIEYSRVAAVRHLHVTLEDEVAKLLLVDHHVPARLIRLHTAVDNV